MAAQYHEYGAQFAAMERREDYLQLRESMEQTAENEGIELHEINL